MIDCCIFDMDGLLLDTEKIYTEVTREIVREFGKDYTWEIKSKMMGRKEMDAAIILVETLDIPISPHEYLDRRNRMQNERFANSELLPGVEQLITHLKTNKIPIAVATSSHKAAFELKTSQNMHVFKLFDVVVTGDDPAVENGKPAPDIFWEAARRLNISEYSKCLVFEDSPTGVQAAINAGMRVCWVPDVNCVRGDIKADIVLSTLEDFDPTIWNLPGFFL